MFAGVERMRILAVGTERLWPPQSGAVQRSYHLVSGLARQHAVTLLSLVRANLPAPNKQDPLRELCENVIEIPKSTCLFSRTDKYNDWSTAPDRLAALVSTRFPRTLQRWHSDVLVS